MGYADILIAYLNAYNTKVKLESDPMLEAGVIEAEEAKLVGHINISAVANYDRAFAQIDSVLPAKIAAQQAIMDGYTAAILEFFAKGSEDITMDTGQKISVSEGVIYVYTPG